jgi:hypothetical protein
MAAVSPLFDSSRTTGKYNPEQHTVMTGEDRNSTEISVAKSSAENHQNRST